MSPNLGWIKLHRQSLDNPIFKKPLIWHYWVYCLLKANSKDNKIIWNNNELTIEKGSFISGLFEESKATGLSAQNLRTSRKTLVNLKMIEISTVKSTVKFSYITVCNYDTYQSQKEEANSLANNQATVKQQSSNSQATTNKNDKNIKNEENEEVKPKRSKVPFIAPTFQEVTDYFLVNGFSAELAQKAFNHYAIANWHDSKGTPVKNWKQKLSTVWFREENKTKSSESSIWTI